jgi:photosystem II stability/assembly factor-like uncharacterized protein
MKNNYFYERLKQLSVIFSTGLFLFSSDLSAQCDSVRWSNPQPVGWNLNSVKFADASTGYASGVNGTIIKTINGGSSWTLLNSNTTLGLGTIFPVNASTVYTSGTNGVVIKSIDGGLHWVFANNGIINTANLTLFFISENIGYAGGSSGDTAVLYKTSNGGLNWSALNTSFLPASFSYISSMYFTSASTGYILANGKVYKTTDGGASFSIQCNNAAFTYSQITFIDANTGYIGGNISGAGTTGGLAKTIDGGLNWIDLTTNINDFNVFVSAIDFLSADTGYVLASHKRSYIIKTVDGGATWLAIDSSSGFNSLGDYNDLDFTHTAAGIAVGTFGRILQTTDGTHFGDISSIPRDFLRSVDFPSENTGYVIHGGVNIVKTTDQGNNWTVINTGSANSLNDISFIDNTTGYAVGLNGAILKTITAGVSWTPQTSTTSNQLNAVQFLNANTGYTGGMGGVLLKTINGGLTWNLLTTGTTNDIKDIYFLNPDTGYFIANVFIGSVPYGYIWKTTNGGANWTKLDFNTLNIVNTVHFPDALHGYIGAGVGLLAKTSDGGLTWQSLNSGISQYDFTSIRFTDADNGYATLEKVVYGPSIRTSTGIIIKTSDGGISWDTLGNDTYPGLTSLAFANSSFGFAVGDESTILKFDLSGNSYGAIQGPGSVCELGNVTYSVATISGTTYNWSLSGGGTISGSGNSITVNWTSTGSYILTVSPSTTTCGNLSSISYPVTVELIPKPVLLLSGNQLISDASIGNTWYLNGQFIANASGQTYHPTQDGDYSVKVVLNGCSSEFSDSYPICICPSGISKNSLGAESTIYPNPNRGNFTLGFSREGYYQVKLINALGEQFFTGLLSETENVIQLPEQLKGLFYLQIRSDKGIAMQKILIE